MRPFDSVAAEMIPIRLVITIVIIAGIAFLLAIGYQNFVVTNAEHHMLNEWNALQSELYSMISSGVARDVDLPGDAEGTKRVYTFSLPESTMFLAFGTDPDPNNDGILEADLLIDGAVLCYQVYGSSKHILWLDKEFRFREGTYTSEQWVLNDEGFILDSGGTSTITFELVKQGESEYILIQATDMYT